MTVDTDSKVTTKLYIDILGRTWMPQSLAAQTLTLEDKDIEWHHIDPFDPDSVENYMYTHSGDFSKIVAYQVHVVQKRTEPPVQDGDWTVVIYGYKTVALKEFTEEEQLQFDDCFSDGME